MRVWWVILFASIAASQTAVAAERRQESADVREMLVMGQWPLALSRLRIELASCEAARPAADECLHLLWMATKAAQGSGDAEEATHFARRALDVASRTLPPGHPDTAHSHLYLAGVLDSVAAYRDSEYHYREALAIREKQQPRDELQLGQVYEGLAGNLDMQGRPEEAEPFLIRALETRENMPESPDRNMALAFSYRDLGARLSAQGRYIDAEKYQRRAYALMLPLVGEGPHTAPYMRALAANLTAQGRMEEAEPLARKALAFTESSISEDSPLIANALSVLAVVVEAKGNTGEAERMLRRSLDIYTRKYPEGHPETASIAIQLSLNLMRQGRAREAEAGFRLGHTLRQKFLAQEAPQVIFSGHALARQLMATEGANPEVRTLLTQAGKAVVARMSAYPGFTDAARAELDDYRGVFRAQVQASWRLSVAAGN